MMAQAQPAARLAGDRGYPISAAVAALASTLLSEVQILGELIGIMRRQRQAVAVDDLQVVEDSVFAIHRILITLSEARRQRRSLNQVIGGTDELALRRLEASLGEHMTESLRAARDEILATATILSREVELNRQVLREALAAGNDYIKAVYGPSGLGGLYAPDSRRVEREPREGLLINRQV